MKTYTLIEADNGGWVVKEGSKVIAAHSNDCELVWWLDLWLAERRPPDEDDDDEPKASNVIDWFPEGAA